MKKIFSLFFSKQHTILLFVILALMAVAPFSNAQQRQLSEETTVKIA